MPLIIRAPNLTKPGTTCDIPVISTDMYPTILALAGLPLRPQQHLDGVSIAALLGGGPAPDSRSLFWHYPHYHGSTWAPGSAIRDQDWKLIEFLEENTVELYNLADDIGEHHNLAAQSPEKVRQLQLKLSAWRSETGALIPKPNAGVVDNDKSAKKLKKKRLEKK
ncbi:MAG: DUF4976 domain-containing protein [Nitrospira sp.]